MIIEVPIKIEIEDVIHNLLLESNEDEVFNLILRIDLHMADIGFTERIRDYFVAEMEKENSYDNLDKP